MTTRERTAWMATAELKSVTLPRAASPKEAGFGVAELHELAIVEDTQA